MLKFDFLLIYLQDTGSQYKIYSMIAPLCCMVLENLSDQ